MFIPKTTPATAQRPDLPNATLGTAFYPIELGFEVMNTNAAFNAAISARVDSATKPTDDIAKGRAYFDRGKANQFKLRAVAIGTGTLKERVSVWTPNDAGTAWNLTLCAEITWTFSGSGRPVLAAMVNGATGSVKYASTFTALVDHTPLNGGTPLKSEPGNEQPCIFFLDTIGGAVIEREGAIDAGITSFNFLTERV